MKNLTLIFVFACLAITVSAQDWAPVPAGCRMVYGLTDTVITQVVWIEGQAGDTVRLNRRIWACDTCRGRIGFDEDASGIVRRAPAYYINQPHTIGSGWSVEDGMIRLLDFQEVGRELRMPFVAEVGANWYWNGGSATLESVEVRDFWGEEDTVRVLLLNGRQRLEWSRNHGLVRFPQPRHENLLRLIGVEREIGRHGITVPTFEMIFDYRVGDRFEVEVPFYFNDFSYTKTRYQHTVKEVGGTYDVVYVASSVRWRRDVYVWAIDPVTNQPDRSKPAILTSFTTGQIEDDTSSIWRRNYTWLGVYPSKAAASYLVNERRGSVIPEQKWAGIMRFVYKPQWRRLAVELEEESQWWRYHLQDSRKPNRYVFTANNPRHAYQERCYAVGLGETYSYESGQSTSRRKLLAWSRGEESYGQFSSESYITSRASPAAAPQVALHPNPTRDVLHLANLPAGARLSIADPLGRIVRQQAPATSIDVSDLPAGLWLLRVEGGNAPQTLRFVKE